MASPRGLFPCEVSGARRALQAYIVSEQRGAALPGLELELARHELLINPLLLQAPGAAPPPPPR